MQYSQSRWLCSFPVNTCGKCAVVQDLVLSASRGHIAPKLWPREQGIPCATSCSHSQMAQRWQGLHPEMCRQVFHLIDLQSKVMWHGISLSVVNINI